MVEDGGGRSEEGTSNSSKKNASNAHSLFPLIFKQELESSKWEGL
jgi:hypothetical protein